MINKKIKNKFLLSLIGLLVLTGITFAYNWETCVGQGGGSITTNLHIDPNDDRVVFASGDFHSGIWKSTNSGDTWRQVNKGLRAMWTWSVAVTPGNSDVVYVATRMGPHKSTDGGLTWEMKRNGMPQLRVDDGNAAPITGIFIHPANINEIYACVGNSTASDRLYDGGAYNPAHNGLWKSTDAGENWQQVSSFPSVPTNTVSFDAQNANRIWVGAGGDTTSVINAGVFRSDDRGATWTRLCTGLPNISTKIGPLIYKIVLHPTNSNIAYAVISGQKNSLPHVFWTTNGGTNWESRSNGLSNSSDVVYPWRGLAMHPTNPNILYATGHYSAVFKSTDAGANWVRKLGNNEPLDNYFSYRNIRDEADFLDWEGCIWWANMNMVVGKQRGVVYTSSISSVHRSYDEGETWTSPTTKAMSNPDNGYYRSTGYATYYIKSISFDPKDPKFVYCTNYDSERFLKSEDGGMHWKYSMTGAYNEHMSARRGDVAVDPDDNRVVYFCERGRTIGSFYRSTNHGDTWAMKRPAGTGSLQCLQMELAPGGTVSTRTIYLVTATGGIYKTTNSAETWTQINNTIGDGDWSVIAVDPKNANILYASSSNGVLIKTTDGGSTWAGISRGVLSGTVYSMAINPHDSRNVFIGSRVPGNLYRSTNAGESWEIVWNKNQVQNAQVNQIAFDPFDSTGKTLFISNSIWGKHYDNDDVPGNPFMSTDGGTNWTPIGDGLDQYHVNVLTVSPHERILWVGTWGSGIARVSIPHLLGQEPSWKGELDKFKEQETSVKPGVANAVRTSQKGVRFNASTKMLWVPVTGKTTIEVFNAAGKRVFRRHVENGSNNALFDMKDLASGMCVVKVTGKQGSNFYRFAAIR